MLRKDVEKSLKKIYEECLAEYGYKFISSEEYFGLKIGEYTYFAFYTVKDYRPEFIVRGGVEIRNEKVENIANRFTNANPDYFKFSVTATIPFSFFTGEFFKFFVFTDNDIKKFNKFFSSVYKDKIHSFLLEHSTLEKLSLFLDKSILEPSKLVPVTIKSYIRSIILLKMIGSPEFENRVQYIRKIIEEYPDYPDMYKQNFEDTYTYLTTHQVL